MNSGLLALATACWLGILTSISPCPLASNIAAISYVGRRVGNSRLVLMAGLLYTLGRALTYLAVALLVIHGLLAVPLLSNFLQRYMNQLLGPILLLTGFLLLDILKLSGRGWRVNAGLQAWLDRHCLIGATLLGSLLALTFCPVSAGIFFGALIPLALRSQAHWLMPLCYGIGTALPVIGFAFVLAFATQWLGLFFGKITIIEFWVRRLTAIILILIGIFLIITRNFGIL